MSSRPEDCALRLQIGEAHIRLSGDPRLLGRFVDVVGHAWDEPHMPGQEAVCLDTDFEVHAGVGEPPSPPPGRCDVVVLHAERAGSSSADGGVTWNDELGCSYRLDGRLLKATYRRPDEAAALDLLQVVRSRAVYANTQKDLTVVHGAVVVLPSGRAVLLAGPKGAGKTTLAVNLCLLGATLVACDKWLLSAGGHAYGIPESLSIVAGTAEAGPFTGSEIRTIAQTGKVAVVPAALLWLQAPQQPVPVSECWLLGDSGHLPVNELEPVDPTQAPVSIRAITSFSYRVHGQWLGQLPVTDATDVARRLSGASFFLLHPAARDRGSLSPLIDR